MRRQLRQRQDGLSLTGEIGAKTSWLHRKVVVNGNFFYTYYDDFQVQTFDGSSIDVFNASFSGMSWDSLSAR